MNLTGTQWRTAVVIVSVVVTYLLTQQTVNLQPVAVVILGAINVALAVLKGPDTTPAA